MTCNIHVKSYILLNLNLLQAACMHVCQQLSLTSWCIHGCTLNLLQPKYWHKTQNQRRSDEMRPHSTPETDLLWIAEGCWCCTVWYCTNNVRFHTRLNCQLSTTPLTNSIHHLSCVQRQQHIQTFKQHYLTTATTTTSTTILHLRTSVLDHCMQQKS